MKMCNKLVKNSKMLQKEIIGFCLLEDGLQIDIWLLRGV